jgi:hypothetical protein
MLPFLENTGYGCIAYGRLNFRGFSYLVAEKSNQAS